MYKKYSFDKNIEVDSLISAFESNYKSDFYFKGEYHNFWEMVYVLEGRAGVSADGKVYELSEGEIIFHKPMEFHKVWAVNGERLRLFIMSFNIGGQIVSNLEGFAAKLDYSQRELAGRLKEILKNGIDFKFSPSGQIDYLVNWDERGYEKQMIKNALELLLVSIACGDAKMKKRSDMRGAEIYMKIVKIMEEHVYDWISVEEIAAQCNFSASYIKKVFKKYASCGIHEYFITLKIKKAVSLMENGYNVRQTSEKLSFGNENYFGVVFKRETGSSPGKYIKRG